MPKKLAYFDLLYDSFIKTALLFLTKEHFSCFSGK